MSGGFKFLLLKFIIPSAAPMQLPDRPSLFPSETQQREKTTDLFHLIVSFSVLPSFLRGGWLRHQYTTQQRIVGFRSFCFEN
mmetsp:Transcript_40892/g.80579  ORF Transcript_40892/g.80579 Transcript_40892/m.80579 type:complete len:82 (+) Transcript_40892:78-323(+)